MSDASMPHATYHGPIVHCASGNSFCVAMAQMCAVVCLILSSSSDSSLVRSLMGSGAGASAASGSATALEKTLWLRRPERDLVHAEPTADVMSDTGTAAGREPVNATAALPTRDPWANLTRRAAASMLLCLPTRTALALTTAGAHAPIEQ